MRSFLFGAVLGAFGVIWCLGVLPEPVESFLNDKLCTLMSMVGIGSDSNAGGASSSGSSETSGGEDFASADALRRSGVFENGHLTQVYTCPGMSITNQPSVSSDGRLKKFKPLIRVEGILIAAAPVSHACLSSGYGSRNGKLHKGLDYHSENVSHVYAAGSGTIMEALYRDDYGNMVVIDHGNGVYTRYAHLKGFASGIKSGKSVDGTTKLGRMGQTAGYSIPVHLHYEVLLGDYNTPAKSFALEPVDPMAY